ncbi:MAG: ribonuclease HII [Candidatus Hadarchaeales archaeon]
MYDPSKKIIAGLDEAGRGPVFGPMVICGAMFDRENLKKLGDIGVRDSKLLTPRRREMLDREIRSIARRIEIVEIQPQEIDRLRMEENVNLNELEAMKFAGIIDALRPDIAYVDAADPDPSTFERRIRKNMKSGTELVVENAADRKYTAVGAASIVAKVRRDARISELREKYGDFGSGYPSDPRTISFISRWVEEHGELPPFARKSWVTSQRLNPKKKD